MGKVILGMTISLDGFVNDDEGSVARLYPNFESARESDVLAEIIRTTGAVVMGRNSYEMGQGDYTGYEFQTPIFVVTHQVPSTTAKGENENLKFHFVTDGIESAIAQAKVAAGDKNVTVIGGASVAQQLLNAGLVDELEMDIAPVLFGTGLPFFDNLHANQITLEQIGILEYRGVAQIRYRVL